MTAHPLEDWLKVIEPEIAEKLSKIRITGYNFTSIHHLISNGFSWEETNEGGKFWMTYLLKLEPLAQKSFEEFCKLKGYQDTIDITLDDL